MKPLVRTGLPFAITLVVTVAFAAPTAYVLAPHVHRWRTLSHLTSDNAGERERAARYVVARAAADERIARGAIARLDGASDEHFVRIVSALEAGGVWDRRRVPHAAWLRWLKLVADTDSTESLVFVAQRLGEVELVDHDVHALLSRLMHSDSSEVRFNALINAASLQRKGVAADAIAAMVLDAISDPEPVIARHAWIVAGLLRLPAAPPSDWATVPPEAAEAALWAMVQLTPEQPDRVIGVLRDALASPELRAAAAYALASSDTDAARAALLHAASPLVPSVTDVNQLVIWRSILALPRPDLARKPLTPLEEVVSAWTADDSAEPLLEPIGLAAVWRLGIAGSRHAAEDEALYDQLLKLATVEGQPDEPPYMFWPLTGFKSPLLRVQTLAVARLPDEVRLDDPREPINAILVALESDDATLRDLGVSVAARRFDEARNRLLVRTLLTDFDENRRRSGAILAGLTGLRVEGEVRGQHVELLTHLAEHENDWGLRQLMRLGLWMRGDLPEMDAQVPTLLLRDDLPDTTILLAMLHRGRLDEALDFLLNPRGEPPLDLIELFDQRRWWDVLRRYLPADAPPFWVWADPALERFQVDVLRDWALTRARADTTR